MRNKLEMKLQAIVVFLLLAPALFGQDQGNIKGYMFGDYYYMAGNHNKEIEDANGFWLRRIYLTYDKGLSEAFAIRLRFEMNSAGDFASKDKLTPVVKDAYLKWKHDRHTVYVGISGTPTWGFVESFWGYRAVEKTALDLQKFGSSRDFGLALKGSLDSGKRLNYHLMVGNGSSNGSENNDGKKVMLALRGKPGSGLIVEGYVDFEERPGKTNRYTLQGFAGYETATFRIGVQIAHQNRQVAGGDDLQLQIGSIFAAARLSSKTWTYVRVDRQFDPNPDGAKISYLPFDSSAKSTFLLAGLDFRPHKNVHLMPNVEVVLYDENNLGASPDTDFMPRLSYYYKF
ncbi:MAG: hypothetical protein ACE5IY_12775 [bacterium]